ncbi:hypothetical protein LCGC14_0571030 [marine sediment metagenome]|uniref:Uncharacterized protein n=1 Tax=marine sediment metagenome TaxID=412755 RepID=A0A0F9RJ44_9ZZZZ
MIDQTWFWLPVPFILLSVALFVIYQSLNGVRE